jgi:catechol 2,3-dioxygenase-like lactoylglutathione lyase family enzyme
MSQASFKITGMDLSGYMVKDAARAIAFYRDVLGLEPVLVYPDNRGAEYEFAVARRSVCGAAAAQ